MSRFIFPIVIMTVLKLYVYGSMYKLFDRKLYKVLTVILAVISFSMIGVTYYTAQTIFARGIIHPPLWGNMAFGLVVSFFVTELMLGAFFVVDEVYGVGERLVHWYQSKDAKQAFFLPRRKFIKRAGTVLAALPFLAFIDGITRGKYNFWINEQQLTFDDLPIAFDGFRIAQISDIHAGSFDNFEAVRRGIKMIQEQQADLILFTGDLVNNHAEEIEPFLEDFKALKAPYGKYSILGNHDYPRRSRMFEDEEHKNRNFAQIKQHHATMGFDLMLNQNTKIEKDGSYIRLLGVENWGRSHHFPKKGDLDTACIGCQESEFNILMSHDPTHWSDKVIDYPKKMHLTLSGHTHGMQMGVYLPQFKWSPVKYAYEHWAGLYENKGQKLFVNTGFGFLAFAGRVGMYPEITIIELKKG